MELILWRHAEAEDSSPDMARALTKKGRNQASRMADWLNPRLPQPVRILMSPALRTVQTAQALGRSCEEVAALAPGGSVDNILAAVGWPDADGCVWSSAISPRWARWRCAFSQGRVATLRFVRAASGGFKAACARTRCKCC